MTPVAVVTDTTHYLPADLVARHDLHLVSLYVRWGDEQERESEMADFGAFYERLRSAKELPTTSQPSIGDFVAVYEPLVAAGRDVLSVHISSGISGTYDAALQAKAQLEEAGHPGRIEVVDSASGCGGLGFVALAACARARAGGSLSEVAEQARQARDQMKLWFAVDTLEFLRRGGRIGAAQAWIGGALKIKPILSIESQITPIERVRTSGKAFERLVQFMHTLAAEGADGWIVQHVQAPDHAERLVERGREVFGTEPVCVSEIGPVIGTHVGPGLLGVGAVPGRLLA